MRKLKRDIVISMTNKGDLVGIYFADTDGSEILLETLPEIADLIIGLWNRKNELKCEHCGDIISDRVIMLDEKCAEDYRIIDKY